MELRFLLRNVVWPALVKADMILCLGRDCAICDRDQWQCAEAGQCFYGKDAEDALARAIKEVRLALDAPVPPRLRGKMASELAQALREMPREE